MITNLISLLRSLCLISDHPFLTGHPCNYVETIIKFLRNLVHLFLILLFYTLVVLDLLTELLTDCLRFVRADLCTERGDLMVLDNFFV